MGWNIDLSAITPGPGGTVMLGEGGIDAAARRYRERVRKQQEEADALAKMRNGEAGKGSDAASEVTLTSEGDGGDKMSVKKEVAVEEGESREGEEMRTNSKDKKDKKDKKYKKKGGLRETWKGFQGVG